MADDDTPALPAPRTTREIRVVEDRNVPIFDTAKFEHMQRIATAMASASLMPAHLKGAGPAEAMGNCFLVVNQALRWALDPFAVAQETYVTKGKLGYQGKLVAAVVNTRAGLRDRLRYTFSGEGDERTVTVSGTFKGDNEPATVDLRLKDARTDNQMWTRDFDQKLVYSGVVKWARRHCPEVILGVLTDDDLERIAAERAIDVTPLRPAPRPVITQHPQSGSKLDQFNEAKPEPEPVQPEPAEAVTEAAEPEIIASTRDPFWSRDSFEIRPMTGKKVEWLKWEEEMRGRVGEAQAPQEVNRLHDENERHIGNYRLVNNDAANVLLDDFTGRRNALA